MKVKCPACQGTGLTMPLCDSECDECAGNGEVEKTFEQQGPVLPDTLDGNLVQQLCDKETLSDWESKFCVSVEQWVVEGKELTAKQRAKIKEILDR